MLDKDTIEKIRSFYDPVIEKENNLFLQQNGQKRYVPYNDQSFYLMFGEKATTPEEALAKGAVEIPCKEMYRIFADKETYSRMKSRHEPDERTERYLSGIKTNIGLLETRAGWDEHLPEENIEARYRIWVPLDSSDTVDVGKVGDHWVAQYVIRTDIDDYQIIGFFYSRKPSERDIRTTALLREIEHYFLFHGWNKNTFTCWECGHENNNWIDIPGSLETKWESFKDKYCGC